MPSHSGMMSSPAMCVTASAPASTANPASPRRDGAPCLSTGLPPFEPQGRPRPTMSERPRPTQLESPKKEKKDKKQKRGDSATRSPSPSPSPSPSRVVSPRAFPRELPPHFIAEEELGPEISLLEDDFPEWRYDVGEGNWRHYNMADSTLLDRYWLVHKKNPSKTMARLFLNRRDCTVDFRLMLCHRPKIVPRRLERHMMRSGYMSNARFVKGFKEALARTEDLGESEAPPLDSEDLFDFRYNQDYRDQQLDPDAELPTRGGNPYYIPFGWKRFAIRVRGSEKYGDDQWLRDDDTGWAIAYHGTSGESLPGILASGFRPGVRQKFREECGDGVYCTFQPDVAQAYSVPALLDGRYVQVVLQVRVRPGSIKPIKSAHASTYEEQYCVVNDPEDIRAYGVLMREFSLLDFVPAEAMVLGFDDIRIKVLMAGYREQAKKDAKKIRAEEKRMKRLGSRSPSGRGMLA